jgi:4-hydroxy-tetrahydrodipicolinate synthase
MNFNSGVYTVLVTPFDDNNNIDFDSLDNLIDKQLNSNVTGLVILGTTSESPTINLEEKKSIVNFVYKRVSGKKKLIVGVGGNNTNNVINFSQFCENLCDGFMVTVPNYNKPTQNGIYQHFSEISNKFPNKPIILYNIPSRCCVNMLPETVKKIYDNHSNVLAIKEASGSMDQVMKIKSLCDIKIFSGDDALVLPIMSLGGDGVISVLSNLCPDKVFEIYDDCFNNDYNSARKNYFKLHQLIKLLFIETNPVPVKEFLFNLGLIKTNNVRLPLCKMTTKLESFEKLLSI